MTRNGDRVVREPRATQSQAIRRIRAGRECHRFGGEAFGVGQDEIAERSSVRFDRQFDT